MTEEEKAGLILLPGLSTRDDRGDLSGLGVGMDAVAAWASSLGGTVGIATQRGRGTRITIRLPAGFETGN
jgi:chemotaxis protein histidine kinase CheA